MKLGDIAYDPEYSDDYGFIITADVISLHLGITRNLDGNEEEGMLFSYLPSEFIF